MKELRPPRPYRLPAGFLLVIISIFYLCGIFFHLLPATRPYMPVLTPYVLFGAGALICYPVLREGKRGVLIWAGATFLLTFFLEAVGVATGAVFGAYSYGDALGAKIAAVPPVIGFNWVLILLGCVRAGERFSLSPVMTGLFTGIAAVVFDLVLEPVAIALDYWTWTGGSIPLQNYAAWFGIAAVAGWFYRRLGLTTNTYVPSWYVLIQLVFFAGLRITGAA